jgi:hypothetical protein
MLSTLSKPLAGGFLSVLFLVPLASAQDAEGLFHEAYYLEHEEGRMERALELYRKVAGSRKAGGELRARAEERAAGIAEEFAAADFARLVPADTILFAQMDRPGQQVEQLLGQLGILGHTHQFADEEFAVSPLLIDYVLGLRGLAVAVTEMKPDGQPGGVLLLHPGRHEGLRGLIETALPAGGERVDSIDGFPVWSVDGEAYVCLTRRLVIASQDRANIAGVVARLAGERGRSLADDERFVRTTTGSEGGLLSFYVNAEPVKPMIRMALEQEAQNDPGAAMAMRLLDIDSLQSFSGRLGVVDDGLALDLALELSEGHRNLVFNLLRRPALGRETVALVPHGAAFFAATAFNEASPVAPIARDGAQQPVVTMLDFGREMFGNVIDAALYGMPSDQGGPIPNVALVMRVNDCERSMALWELGLGMASQATGGGSAPDSELIGDTDVWIYPIQGVPVYLAAEDERVVISTEMASVKYALSQKRKKTVLSDSVFAPSLAILDESPTALIAACPGRIGKMARPFMGDEEAAEMAPILSLLDQTSITLSARHSNTTFALGARVHNIPDVSGLVTQALAEQRRGQSEWDGASGAVKTAKSGGLESMTKEFEQLVRAGNHNGAAQLADRMVATVDDAKALNNLAWSLLTEDRYTGEYDDVALVLSQRSNELTGESNWYYLDTLALAEFRAGNARTAAELQRRVLELSGGEGDQAELQRSLDLYRVGLEERPDPLVHSGAR